MKTYKVKTRENKGRQHFMVHNSIDHWRCLNNAAYTLYTNVMNMKTYRWNDVPYCYVAVTYYIKLNKW